MNKDGCPSGKGRRLLISCESFEGSNPSPSSNGVCRCSIELNIPMHKVGP